MTSLLYCADRAELQRGSMGQIAYGEGSSGPVQSDVVMARAAQGSSHQ